MEYNIDTVHPPFCKFNILSIPPHAHVLKRRIDPDGLTLFLLRRSVNRKPCETIPETFRYRKNVARLSSVLKGRAVSIFQGLLISCNQMSAEYLFMTDKLYDVRYDTGDKVIQCVARQGTKSIALLQKIRFYAFSLSTRHFPR